MVDPKQRNPEVLNVAMKSASYNIILQVMMRIVSFLCNAVIIRYISREVLGVINVRLMLLYSTTQCLSREGFRKSCLCRINQKNRQEVINLLWLSVPVCFFTGLLLRYVWLNLLEPPDPEFVPYYTSGVNIILLSTFIEITTEPLYVLSQSFHFVKLKVIIEGFSLSCKSLCMVISVIKWPHLGVRAFCLSQILSSVIYAVGYYAYFIWYFHLRRAPDKATMPLTSIAQVFPSIPRNKSFVDKNLLDLSWSFYKQTILKQFLTEGERYIMTLFNVLSFSEQGTYDIVSNLGSLAARLIFLPIEESGYLLFSHLVKRGQKNSDNRTQLELSLHVLQHLLKLMFLLGLSIVVFGYFYSQLLLLWYGGENLSNSSALPLMRWHCFYIFFLAINGISECFSMAAMNSQEIDRFNQKMIGFSVVFLVMSCCSTSMYGAVGFILANCLNASLRIVHSFCFIGQFFNKTLFHFITSFLPHCGVLTLYIVISIVAAISENQFCCYQGINMWTVHLGVGAVCFLILICVIYVMEKDLIHFIQDQFLQRKILRKRD